MRHGTNAYIPTLDGWRAIPVVGVIFYHARTIHLGTLSLRGIQDSGAFGVQLFFAISGILICGLLLQEEERNGSFSLRNFYLRRMFRIQPAAIVYLLFVAVLGVMGSIPMPAGAWFSSLFGVRNIYAGYVPISTQTVYTNHFWTLGVEEQFYLFLPFFLVIVRSHRIAVLGTISLSAIIWTSLAHRFHWVGLSSSGRTDLQIGGLLFASTLALVLRIPQCKDWLRRWTGALAIASIFAFVVSLGLLHNRYSAPIANIGFPLIILATILHSDSFVSRLLESRPLVYLGRISFSVYLWQ